MTNFHSRCMISNVSGRHNRHNKLCASGSVGGARPCQGRGRGFESRLALSFNKKDIRWMSFFVKSSPAGPGRSRSTLRSGRRRADVHWTSCAVSRSEKRKHPNGCFLFLSTSICNQVHPVCAAAMPSAPAAAPSLSY